MNLRTNAPQLLLVVLLALPLALSAQQDVFHCGANELGRMASLINNDPSRYEDIQQAKAQLEHFTATWQGNPARDGEPYVIPVVFHIIHNNGPENISDDQVRDGIRVMNEDYNKMNASWPNVQPEFLDIVANVGITFKLAQLDPDGNCTNGITRTVSPLTNDGGQDMKDLIDWPRDRYLNIWVAASAGGAAGYSMYPSSVSSGWGAAADGIVVLHSYVGAIGTSDLSHSHTLSHEAGHWMNLKHCWGDSNNPGLLENCGMDDGVTDTPNTVGWDSCDLTGASCGSDLDNVENFMEYSYCSKMFTEGQKARMIAALNSGIADRDNLWTDSNLALTGLASPPQICAVQFNSNTRTVCAGDEIEFSDASYNGVTEWSWTFEGGVPATSEVADPVVTYDTPGLYSVGLTVGNGTETASSTEQQYVKVLPMSGLPLPFAEGFEDVGTLPSADWMVDNINGDGTFQVSATAAYTGTRSAHLGNNSSNAGHKDELLSNTIDITSDPPVVVSFRYAFAQRNSSNDDVLRVYASRDCGETWTLRRTLIGSALATAPLQGGSFTPNGPEQWGYSETAPIGGLYAVSDLRLKFSFQSDGGNDLWLDDINITGATAAISEAGTPSGDALQVVPNPAGQEATLVADLAAGGPVQVDLLDILGRPVRLVADEAMPAGIARWKLSLDGLPGGLYLVRLQERDAVRVVRFTKN